MRLLNVYQGGSMSRTLTVDAMYELLRANAADEPGFKDPDFQTFVRLAKVFIPPTTQAIYNILACAGIAFTAVEIAIMRGSAEDPEIVLGTRGHGDVLYAGKEHSYGSMLRPSDGLVENDVKILNPGIFGSEIFFAAPAERVLGELGFSKEEILRKGVDLFSQPPILVGAFPHQTPRGTENANLFIAEIFGEPKNGRFVKLNKVLANPKKFNLIGHHIAVLAQFKHRYANYYPTLRTWKGW